MFARMNHVAMTGPQYPLLERDCRSLFGFRNSGRNDAEASTVVGDGDAGLNMLPRRDGQVGGIDRFGMVVERDCRAVDRMKCNNSRANIVRRSACRFAAAHRGHGGDGNRRDIAVA
jgi:hypothetical protein